MNVMQYLSTLFQTGLGSLAAYLAAHVLLCLLPAFFIAGALSALIPKQAITRYLGRKTPNGFRIRLQLLVGFVLAVCSCTIMPLFASIYKKGAGLGPAITFLFVGPADKHPGDITHRGGDRDGHRTGARSSLHCVWCCDRFADGLDFPRR